MSNKRPEWLSALLAWFVVGIVFVSIVAIPFHLKHDNSYWYECMLGFIVYSFMTGTAALIYFIIWVLFLREK